MAGIHSLRASLAADPEAVERMELLFSKEADVKTFISQVFSTPLDFPGPVTTIPKATLVVGAGKLERAKFSEDLPKWVVASLRDLGFQDDRGASALLACAGSYKYQHDTGKNEKFIQVFPKINVVSPKEKASHGDSASKQQATEESMCIESSLETFQDMVDKKIKSWSCKKRCAAMLKKTQSLWEETQQKLSNRLPLSESEQDLFDSALQLEEKLVLVRSEMVKQVDDQKLSKGERQEALEQIQARIAEGNPLTEAMKKRLALFETSTSSWFVPLENEDRIKLLWKRCIACEPLVEKAGPKGRWNASLSPSEVAKLGEKEEWEEEIQHWIQKSRMWFETEEEIAFRVKQTKAQVAKSKPQAVAKPQIAATSSASSSSSWSTVKAPAKSSSATTSSKSKSASSAKNSFAALGGDSDSD